MNRFLGLLQNLVSGSDPSTLTGPGYVARLPAGFTAHPMPRPGCYVLLPPGSTPPPVSPATVFIEPVYPQFVPAVLQQLHGMENPFAAQMNAMSLGLQGVTALAPARQVALPAGTAHIRELDCVAMSGQPLRMIMVVLLGTHGTVRLIIAVNLTRWTEFLAPCLEFLGTVNPSGGAPCSSEVRSVIDPRHPEQVEFRLVQNGQMAVPFSAFPTKVAGQQVYNPAQVINNYHYYGDVDQSKYEDRSIRDVQINGSKGTSIGDRCTSIVS